MKNILFAILPIIASCGPNDSVVQTDLYKGKEKSQIPKKNRNNPEISENLQRGQFLRLTDGTLWKIRPSDTLLTQSWITPADIIISDSGDSEYPYKLTNSLTTSSVLAKKVNSM